METEQSLPPTKEKISQLQYLEWQDYEYDHKDKGSDWFWVVGLVGLISIILAIIFKNFLFAIILLISTFLVMLYGTRQPELINFQINQRGLKAKDDLFLFDTLKTFAIKSDTKPYKLMIESSRLFLPHIIIPLGDTDPQEVRRVLSRFLPEVPFHESLIDLLAERLGF